MCRKETQLKGGLSKHFTCFQALFLKKSLDEEEIATVMEIAEVIERGRKDKIPAL